jgi:hypothetical protein
MLEFLKREKATRLDLPEKHRSSRQPLRYEVRDVWKSMPEMILVGAAVFLMLVGALKVLVALAAAVVGGMGLWGKVKKGKG